MVKAIFFDIDGTLVSLRTHTAPASTLRALEELRARGVKLFIASGRPPYQIEFLSRQLPFRFDGFVLLNGQYCIDGEGRVLHRHALPQASFRELLPYLEREQIAVSFMELDGCYFNRINDRVERLWADLGGTVPHEPVADPARALTEATYQLNAFVPPEEEAEFLRHLPGAKAVRWCPYFADIVPADGGKPVGVRAVCEHYGIALADTMAFGDGGNDADMLRCAGVGVALGNGDEAAKRAADYITDDVDADGVYNALRHFGVLE